MLVYLALCLSALVLPRRLPVALSWLRARLLSLVAMSPLVVALRRSVPPVASALLAARVLLVVMLIFRLVRASSRLVGALRLLAAAAPLAPLAPLSLHLPMVSA
jgi:hypothetical protein